MKAVVVIPGKFAKIEDIDRGLESYQNIVNGDIEQVYPFDDEVAIVCNDEGKYNGELPNRGLFDDEHRLYDIVFGTFIVVGLSEDDFDDLSDDLAMKYEKMFHFPERFYRMGDEIFSQKVQTEF